MCLGCGCASLVRGCKGQETQRQLQAEPPVYQVQKAACHPAKGLGPWTSYTCVIKGFTERLHHQVQNCDRIDQTGESTQPQIRRLTSFWGPVLLYMSLSLLRAPFTGEVFRVARRLRFVDTSFVNFLCGTTKSCSCICLPGIMWTWWQVVGPGVRSQWIRSCSDSRSRHHTF